MKIFLFLACLSIAFCAEAQGGLRIEHVDTTLIFNKTDFGQPAFKIFPTSKSNAPRLLPLAEIFSPPFGAAVRVPGIYDYHHIPFFCRIEVDVEKRIQLPVKFRLGSVQYVDWLEQK